MTRRWWTAMGLVIVASAGVRADVLDRVLAVVGSQVITLSDVRAAETFGLVPPSAKAGTQTDVLRQWIDRQLMLSEVERYAAPDPERTLVERRLGEIRAAFSSPSEYANALARTAMSEERLRLVVADNLRIDAYVDQRFSAAAQPTPEEVQRYYREHPDEFSRNGRLAPFEDVQVDAQQRAAADRRRALMTDWLDRLRRRGVTTNR